MRTKIVLLSATVLLSAGVAMHHARYCPLQHLRSALAHHTNPAPAKDAKTASLAINR